LVEFYARSASQSQANRKVSALSAFPRFGSDASVVLGVTEHRLDGLFAFSVQDGHLA
jgi:hypothetical protein